MCRTFVKITSYVTKLSSLKIIIYIFINVERSTGSKCTDFRAKVAGVSQSLSKPPQRMAGSGFEIALKYQSTSFPGSFLLWSKAA